MIARNPNGSLSVSLVLAVSGMALTLVLAIVGAIFAMDGKYATKGQLEQLTTDVREVRADIKLLLQRIPAKAK